MRSLKGLAILVAGFAVGVLPAMGSSTTVTDSGANWVPSTVQIHVGDDVKWNWTGFHNVAFDDGARSGSPTSGGSFERTFTTSGAFTYRCEVHGGMTGAVNVTQASTDTTGTGTDTTGTDTTPTTTTPTTTTPTTTTESDSTGPVITNLRRRASRTALRISFTSSEDGNVEATIRRRDPGRRAFRLVATRVRAMDKGANVLTLQRAARRLRRGTYRVTLEFFDLSEHKTRRILVFKIA